MGRRTAVGAGTALGASVLFVPAAEAGTFTVTNTENSGEGSLRQEVFDAKEAAGDDVVVFQAGLSGTISLSGADSDMEVTGDSLAIQGPGADLITVEGAGDDRIFHLYGFGPGKAVSISGLTLTGGAGGALGGAILMEPGSVNAADLTLAEMVVTDSSAGAGGGVGINGGALTIANSAITGNAATGAGGGVEANGVGEVLIEGSLLYGNSADIAGGVRLYHGDDAATIRTSTFVGNQAEDVGGGASLYDITGPVTVDASTFASNGARNGGGLVLWGQDEAVTVRNSTLSGNTAEEQGGGIWSNNSRDTERVFTNSTVFANSASEGGGIWAQLADDGAAGDEVHVLASTIVARNSATGEEPDLGDNDEIDPEDLGLFSMGFSLVERPSDVPGVENPAGTNVLGADPLLEPLAPNGGPTPTHLPGPLSAALEAGIAGGLAVDQRGLPRTVDLTEIGSPPGSDATDIGAVELSQPEARINCQGEELVVRTGGDGNDALVGTDAADAIFGLGGEDTIAGVGGDDCLNGGGGRDLLRGGGGGDQLKGRESNDRIKGQAGKDRLRGQGGKDKLDGGGAKDRLAGGAGRDTVKGGPGKDKLKGNSARDRIIGGGGRDEINCGGGRDRVSAGPKDDVSRNCERVIEAG